MATEQIKPTYWKTSVEEIKQLNATLSKIPGNYLGYETCNKIRSYLTDYGEVCKKLQETEYGEVEEVPKRPLKEKCPRCGKPLIWTVTGEPTAKIRYGYWSCPSFDFGGCSYVERRRRVK